MAAKRARHRLIRAALRAARDHATPFYLFDRQGARENIRRWRDLAGDFAEVFYPYKCNRHPALLDLTQRGGLGAEVTIAPDVDEARSRLSGERIVFQGPAKDPRSVLRVLASGGWLVADSPEDATAILSAARELPVAPKYLLRLRPKSAEPEQGRFGMEEREVLALARRILRQGLPAPGGLAFHLGTGLAGHAGHTAAIRAAAGVWRALGAFGVAPASPTSPIGCQ